MGILLDLIGGVIGRVLVYGLADRVLFCGVGVCVSRGTIWIKIKKLNVNMQSG